MFTGASLMSACLPVCPLINFLVQKFALPVQMALVGAISFGLIVGFLAIRHRAMARWNTVAGLAVPVLFLVRDTQAVLHASRRVEALTTPCRYGIEAFECGANSTKSPMAASHITQLLL